MHGDLPSLTAALLKPQHCVVCLVWQPAAPMHLLTWGELLSA